MKMEFKEPKAIPGFHALEFAWKVKEETSKEIYGLSYEELMKYFDDRERKFAEQGIVLRGENRKKELAFA